MRLNLKYLYTAVVLLVMEVLIALFVRDAFVRPYVGDFLVVILLHYLVRAFTPWKWTWVAIGVLGFAYMMELGQYLEVRKVLGFEKREWIGVMMGTRFEWEDMLAYTLGLGAVALLERRK